MVGYHFVTNAYDRHDNQEENYKMKIYKSFRHTVSLGHIVSFPLMIATIVQRLQVKQAD